MLSRLARRRVRIERIEAEAEAIPDAIAKDWSRVALAVARKTGKRVGLDASAFTRSPTAAPRRSEQAPSWMPWAATGLVIDAGVGPANLRGVPHQAWHGTAIGGFGHGSKGARNSPARSSQPPKQGETNAE